ncbi:General transcription factor IIE subunit 2 [Lamellibrachia satsuma]|nr:General transcription factor IIE subunit 2 [Lamellibrachia satsuma]
MDPSLVRERALFKERALAMPIVEKRKVREDDSAKHRPSKKARPTPPARDFDYKGTGGSSQYKFGILAKIVKFMKQRRQEGDMFPLTIDEILDETNQPDASIRHKHWLVTEALNNNPKIEVVEGDKYLFRPTLSVRDRKGLLRLLDKHDQHGLGGILMDDVEESVPRTQKVLKQLGDQVLIVNRPIDKKKILFYNDKSYNFKVDDELQKLWRGVAVDGTDEGKIEEYLRKQGITSMQDAGLKKVVPQKRKSGSRKKNRLLKTHNEHVKDVLQDYTETK